jgi:DEAD/DEAH box helicase domain-containing protein
MAGQEVALVDRSGAPSSAKHFVFYNPPALNADGSMRQSAIDAAAKLASRFISGESRQCLRPIRISVELLVSTLERLQLNGSRRIASRATGRVPAQRAKGHRERVARGRDPGRSRHNALELGIDISGTWTAPFWQATRHDRQHLAASGASRKAYGHQCGNHDRGIVSPRPVYSEKPRLLLSQSPEYALCEPDNPYIWAST